jgi:hypothetical protein
LNIGKVNVGQCSAVFTELFEEPVRDIENNQVSTGC